MKFVMSFLISALTAMFLLTACKPAEPSSRSQQLQDQERVAQSANQSVPAYQSKNFLVRKALNEYSKRLDTPNKTFYVYLLSSSGFVGYFVANLKPVATCDSMTPTERVVVNGSGSRTASTVSAPNLNGVYTKGGCNSLFFFDATTNALIETRGMGLSTIATDVPIQLDVPQLHMAIEK